MQGWIIFNRQMLCLGQDGVFDVIDRNKAHVFTKASAVSTLKAKAGARGDEKPAYIAHVRWHGVNREMKILDGGKVIPAYPIPDRLKNKTQDSIDSGLSPSQ